MAQTAEAARLFGEYGRSLGDHLCTATLAAEIVALPGPYSAPSGGLWLAQRQCRAVGCVGVTPAAPGVLELRRFFVQPEARGFGIGRALLEAAIQGARTRGAHEMRLETLPDFAAAVRLYRRVGFQVGCIDAPQNPWIMTLRLHPELPV